MDESPSTVVGSVGLWVNKYIPHGMRSGTTTSTGFFIITPISSIINLVAIIRVWILRYKVVT